MKRRLSLPGNGFSLWSPVVTRVQLGHAEDFRIMRADGVKAAYQCGYALGVCGSGLYSIGIYRVGRRDA